MHEYGNNYTTQGKRLLTLGEFSELLLPNECQVDHVKISHLNLVNDEPDAWLPIDIGNGSWAAMPGPEFCPRLYRGQSKWHRTCKASIFRESSAIEYLVAVTKLLEFYGYCESHHGVHYLRSLEIMGKQGRVDLESQAQHYNLPTTILDFSRSLDVAEFFARCRKAVAEPDFECAWEMVPRSEFNGVLYTADFRGILSDDKLRDAFILTVPSPFLRPHRQKAVGMSLGGNCLTKMSFMEERYLEFSERRAMELLEKFSGGRFLFPDDAIGRVSEELRTTKELILDAFKVAAAHVKAPEPVESLMAGAQAAGYTFTHKRSFLTPGHVKDLEKEWHSVSQEIRRTMGIRLAADHLQPG
jgi:hypothetical protein